MERTRFDGLRVIRREWEGRDGRAEVCRGPEGERCIRLCLTSPACQRELLGALDAGASVRLEGDTLELLLPWREGVSLERWLRERQPDLAQRREACLSLLEQQLTSPLPSCLTIPSARRENLRFSDTGAALQALPDLRRWERDRPPDRAVDALAQLLREIMTGEMGRAQRRRFPRELQLLCRRTQCGGYRELGQLQRDVAAIPDALSPRALPLRAWAERGRRWLRGHGRAAARVLTGLLAAAAVLSLAGAVRDWKAARRDSWPGIVLVGEQELR